MQYRVLLAATLVVGCSNPPPAPPPVAFDRPEAVAFFCWDLEADEPVPLARCEAEEVDTGQDDLAEPAEGLALHALVTQTATGEVAAVRLSGRNGEPGAIDSDVRVPGFTFVATGDVPSGIVISQENPNFVYVVSRGSGQLHVIETAAFRQGLGTQPRVYEAGELLPPGARPSAITLTPDERQLVVALPTLGQLAFVPIEEDGGLASPTFIDLSREIPTPVDLREVPPEDLSPPHVFTCPADLAVSQPTPVAPRSPISLGEQPQPSFLLVDPGPDPTDLSDDILLVADRALPLIHRIDLSDPTGTPLPPLSVSVPTRALAVTPAVPASVASPADAGPPTERFLYAIDEIDRTVLAVDLSDPDRGSYGAVLPVNVSPPTDRLAIPLPARALAVATPGYSTDAFSLCTDAQQGALASGVSLQGVFLAVGTVDGRVRLFDIYDLDTPCRGTTCADASANPNPNDEIVAIGRHRPRIGASIQETVQVTPAPIWSGTATALTVANDGTTDQPERVPNLGEQSCDAPLAPVFPTDGGATRICAVNDPWAAINQTFTLSWQAAIPGTTTTGANIDPDEPVIETRSDYCELGVLGADNVPEEGPLSGYAGDRVVITADLPPSVLAGSPETLTFCESLTQRTASGSTTPVVLPLLSAATPDDIRDTYRGRLTVGDPVVPEGFTFADVRRCYPELLEIEVQVNGAFLTRSSRAGFRHPVVRGTDGRCEVDPDAYAELSRGRAFCGEELQTPEMQLTLGACSAENIGEAASLEFVVGEVPLPLSLDVSAVSGSSVPSLLQSLLYNEIDQRLYAVDQSTQGLVRIRLRSLGIQQTFR